jgi:hypothetical protein
MSVWYYTNLEFCGIQLDSTQAFTIFICTSSLSLPALLSSLTSDSCLPSPVFCPPRVS